MKKFQIKYHLEKGQVLPLVVIMLFVIIGMVALILDGGSIMSNRRTAQAAADAGALAGAKRACLGKTDAKTVAENYATTKNNATSATATVSGKQVTVVASVEHPSFFAKIFGQQTLKANAEATAGCYGVRGKSVIPLAWNCRAPSVGGGPFNPAYGCKIQTLSWNLLGPMADPNWNPASERKTSVPIPDYDRNIKYYYMSGTSIVDNAGIPPEQIYIIIDSDKICLEDDPLKGVVQCDLDGDGKKDIQLGGDRGWLYLTAGTSNIANWITANGPHPNFSLDPHKWLSGKSGNDVNIYNAMMTSTLAYAGQVVLIPVYNELCLGDPRTDSTCVDKAHASPPWPAFDGADDFSEIRNKSLNYHIIAFEPFYVSCVSRKGSDCPGFKYATTLPKGSELKDEPVIEGFFLTNVDVSLDIDNYCAINLGNCTVSLSK